MDSKFSATCLFVSLSSPFKTGYASPTHTTVFPKGTSVISQLSLSSRPSSINRELWDGVMRYCPNSPLPVMTLFWRFQGHWASGVGCFRLLIILTLPVLSSTKRASVWRPELPNTLYWLASVNEGMKARSDRCRLVWMSKGWPISPRTDTCCKRMSPSRSSTLTK